MRSPAAGCGREPTRWSTAWSTSSAGFAPRSPAPRCWPASNPTTTSAWSAIPGSSLMDLLRPKPSSQPAAASLPDALAVLVGRSVAGVLSEADRSFSGVSAQWMGDYRF